MQMLAVNFFRLSPFYSKPSLLFLPDLRCFPFRRGAPCRSGPKLSPWSRLCRRSLEILRSCSILDPQVVKECAGRGCGLEIDADGIAQLEICATRALPPALSLEEGFDKIKKAVEELKVAVPPSVKALNWLCCQHSGLSVYPQFYLESPDSSLELYSRKGAIHACGIGASIVVHGPLHTVQWYKLISRAYGFLGIRCNEGSSLEESLDSYYFFIPQVEVNELMSCSILTATLVWDNCMSYTFADVTHNFELCVEQLQMILHVPQASISDKFWMNNANGKSPFTGKEDLQMIKNTFVLGHGMASCK